MTVLFLALVLTQKNSLEVKKNLVLRLLLYEIEIDR
jgi:hypothetical protein